MDEDAIREHAQALCDALVAGDIDRAATDFSPELRKHMGEVVGLLPLPSTEATVQSVERGGSSYIVLLHLVGESEEVVVQTRWKDRDGRPTMIEASHQSRQELAPAAGEAEGEAQVEGQGQDLAG
jgi:hypothetical protein